MDSISPPNVGAGGGKDLAQNNDEFDGRHSPPYPPFGVPAAPEIVVKPQPQRSSAGYDAPSLQPEPSIPTASSTTATTIPTSTDSSIIANTTTTTTTTTTTSSLSSRSSSSPLEQVLESIPSALLSFLHTSDACNLRACNKFIYAAVKEHKWDDEYTPIDSYILWRQCFPKAIAARLKQKRYPLDDDDNLSGLETLIIPPVDKGRSSLSFETLRGSIRKFVMRHFDFSPRGSWDYFAGFSDTIKEFDMNHCEEFRITDEMLASLKGARILRIASAQIEGTHPFLHMQDVCVLDISNTSWSSFSTCDDPSKVFEHLKSLQTLHFQASAPDEYNNEPTWPGISDKIFIPFAKFTSLQELHIANQPFTDAIFSYLHNLHTLTISGCANITDYAFVYLQRLRVLDISNSSQNTISDAAFQHLVHLVELNMSNCTQGTITDNAFRQLQCLEVLNISGCNGIASSKLTDNLFRHVKRLKALFASNTMLGDKAFEYLFEGDGSSLLTTLDISDCPFITSAAFQCIPNVSCLKMSGCSQIALSDTAFSYLQKGLTKLDISGCSQVTDAAFEYLQGLQELEMMGCNQRTITDNAFKYFPSSLRSLNMAGCNQETITDMAFKHFCGSERNAGSSLVYLDIRNCNQSGLTSKAFKYIKNVRGTVISHYCSPMLFLSLRCEFDLIESRTYPGRFYFYNDGTTHRSARYKELQTHFPVGASVWYDTDLPEGWVRLGFAEAAKTVMAAVEGKAGEEAAVNETWYLNLMNGFATTTVPRSPAYYNLIYGFSYI